MSALCRANIDEELDSQYYRLFGEHAFTIPTLPPELDGNKEYNNGMIQWCIDNEQPIDVFWKENFPEEYKGYMELFNDPDIML